MKVMLGARRRVTGIAVLYGLFCFLMGISPFGFPGIQFLVLTIFGFLYFTARPWWEARKARAAAMRLTRDQISDQVPEARFELWMENQRTPFSVLFSCAGRIGWWGSVRNSWSRHLRSWLS